MTSSIPLLRGQGYHALRGLKSTLDKDFGRNHDRVQPAFWYTPLQDQSAHSTVAATKKTKLVVGRTEYIDLPDWGIQNLLAKVDTGARTSALHVEELRMLSANRVSFRVIVSRARTGRSVWVEAEVIKWAKVRSSSGHYSTRCFVRTRAKLGAVEKEIDLSLDSRDQMNFRMLLGRKALARDFVVDVSKQHALRKALARQNGARKASRKKSRSGEA